MTKGKQQIFFPFKTIKFLKEFHLVPIVVFPVITKIYIAILLKFLTFFLLSSLIMHQLYDIYISMKYIIPITSLCFRFTNN